MAEFKKLSDVEVVAEPAESANVLIEEDGVIKKAPKTAVGGAGENKVFVIHKRFSSGDGIGGVSDGKSPDEATYDFDLEELRSVLVKNKVASFILEIVYEYEEEDHTFVLTNPVKYDTSEYGTYISFMNPLSDGTYQTIVLTIGGDYVIAETR